MVILEILALVLMVVSTIISMVFRPKPIPPAAAALSDFTVPTADPGRPIPIIFGTVLVKGPNVVWFGDLRTVPIQAPSGGSGSGGGGGS